MIPHEITGEHILEALRQIDREGVPDAHQSTKFDLLYEGKRYPPKYVVSLANSYVSGEKLSHKEFSGGEEVNSFLEAREFTVIEKESDRAGLVREELEFRRRTWATLLERGGSNTAEPQLLRELGIYGGAQGVWVNKARTANLTEDGTGVTVGVARNRYRRGYRRSPRGLGLLLPVAR